MKKSLFYTDQEFATFTFFTRRTKRNTESRKLQLTAYSHLHSFIRNYATNKPSYDEEMRLVYINFIKALLHNKLNLHKSKFMNYEEIIKFMEEFQGDRLLFINYD
jgi:hypothetical protein